MDRNDRRNPPRAFSGCGWVALLVSGIPFFTFLIIFQTWMANSPEWQARLYGTQTQGMVKSIEDDCATNIPDPNLINGGFVLKSLLPLTQIQTNVLPTIEFTDSRGHRYDVRENYCGDYGVGEQVTVWYLPDHPTTFALAYETDSTLLDVSIPLIGMAIFFPFMVGAVVLLVLSIVRGRRTTREGSALLFRSRRL